jgi:putative SOS response-associated peptidase YedK
MCYYSSISVGFKVVETRFGVTFVQSELHQPVYSACGFSYPRLPVITGEDPLHVSFLQWGLIPFWVKDEVEAQKMRGQALNARAEAIFEKPMFRHAVMSKRCLVLVDGFFEWRHVNRKTYPYYIRLADHGPFALAGIWDRWKDRIKGTETMTFSIVTTGANSLMTEIHNTRKRMPVILPKANERQWIDAGADRATIESMLVPYDSNAMEAYPVDRSVTKLGYNTTVPAVLLKREYEGLPPLESQRGPLPLSPWIQAPSRE